MMKRFVSVLCVLAMLLTVLPVGAAAANTETGFDLTMDVAATTSDGATARELNDLRAGDLVTVKLNVPGGYAFIGAQAQIYFDNTKFEVSSAPTTGLKPTADGTAGGWSAVQTTAKSNANSLGYVATAGTGQVYDENEEALVDGNYTMTADWTILTAKFQVKENVNGAASFSVSTEGSTDAPLVFSYDNNGTTTNYAVGIPDAQPVTIVQELNSAIALSGAVTTPAKGVVDASNVTGENVTAAVTWSPALVENTFAANTEYTATITVTPNTGYAFGTDASVSLDGYTFTRSGSSFVATKTFERTTLKEVSSLEVTVDPTKTYTHGDTIAQSDMTVKATYDDGSVDEDFKGYSIAYGDDEDGTYLKKGDTKALAYVTVSGSQIGDYADFSAVGQKTLSLFGLTAKDRTYDGTTTVELQGGQLEGVLAGEDVGATMPTTGTIDRPNVTEDETNVTFAMPELTGADAGNYKLPEECPPIPVSITKRPLTITAASASKAYDGTALTASDYTISSETPLATGDSIQYVMINSTITDVGSTNNEIAEYQIVRSGDVVTDNYKVTCVTGTLTVTKASITPTVSLDGWTYGQTAKTPTVTGNSGNGNVTYTYYSDDACENALGAQPTDAGTYYVKATVEATTNYKDATTDAASFTIAKAAAPTGITGSISAYHMNSNGITFNIGSLTGTPETGWSGAKFGEPGYTGAAISGVAMGSDNTKLIITPSGTAGAGQTATITVQVTSDNYETAAVTITFSTIDVAFENVTPTVKVSPVYGDTWAEIVTAVSGTAKIGDDTVAGTFSVQNPTDCPAAGEQTYTILFSSTDGNHTNLVAGTGSVTIAKRQITVTANNASKVYDGTALTMNGKSLENCYTITSGSLATGDAIALGSLSGTITVVGEVDNTIVIEKIAHGEADVTGNYTITCAKGTLTVTARPISNSVITVSAIDAVTYSGSAHTPEPIVKMGENTANEKTLTKGTDYELSYTNNTAAGTATVTIAGKGNFSGSRTTTFAIEKKTVASADYTASVPATADYTGQPFTATVTAADGVTGLGTPTITYTPAGGQATTTAPKNAGTYTVHVRFAEGANYAAADAIELGTFTIDKATLTPTATVADKVYNGSIEDAVVTVSFTGLVNGETLTEGTDYTVSALYDSSNAADAVTVRIYISMKSDKAKNYTVADFTATGKIAKATSTLSLTAANAVYTGAVYAGTLTPTSNVSTASVTYTYYSDAACTSALSGAPTAAGTYYVKAYLPADLKNFTAATSDAVRFEITKAPLTIAAKAKTITYGDAPANDGVTCAGFVGSDSATGVTVEYDYNYAQNGSVGEYTITPKNATGDVLANYAITYTTGKLTVEKKTLTLTWAADAEYYYNAQPQGVTATLTGTVGGDDVKLTLAGATRTEPGSYTAKAAITGTKTGNYNLPNNLTKSFTIRTALAESDLSVSDSNVTATIDGLTIKLTGYVASEDAKAELTVNSQTETVAANGVTYTIDKTGVAVKPVELEIEQPDTITPSGDEAGSITDPSAPDLLNAVANAIIGAAGQQQENVKKAVVTLEITVTKRDANLVLEIKPVVTYHDENGNPIGDKEQVSNENIAAPITIEVTLPEGFTPRYAKHYLANGGVEYLRISFNTTTRKASWKQSSFSEVELVADTREVTVNFNLADGSIVTRTLTPADVGSALPTDSKPGYTFSGWTCEGFTSPSKTLTDAFLTALCDQATAASASALDLTASFSASGGFSGGISGGATAAEDEEPAHAACDQFTDITEETWCHDEVEFAYARGLMNGVTTTTFDVSRTLNRGMFVTILYRLAGSPAVTGESRFTDVTDATWCRDAVLWAAENRIVNGYADGTFRPGAAVTRQQLVTFLYRYAALAGYDTAADVDALSAFADADSAAEYARAPLAWASGAGILQGANGSILPTRETNRGQTAAFLVRFLNLYETEAK